jgi:hypothetical protein
LVRQSACGEHGFVAFSVVDQHVVSGFCRLVAHRRIAAIILAEAWYLVAGAKSFFPAPLQTP